MQVSLSPKFTMTQADWERWFANQMYFLRPLALVYLGYVGVQMKVHGPDFSNFVPDMAMLGATEMYCINALTDFLRKFVPQDVVTVPDTQTPPEKPLQEATDPNPTVIDTSLLK